MQALKDRRIALAAGGAALALFAGLGMAMVLMRHAGDENVRPPAAQAGLVVETGSNDDGKLDPTARLRCFVAGQFVGEATLAECAKRNGVATGALDVGVDESGALAAADQAGAMLVPLPPPAKVLPAEPAPTAATTAAPTGPTGACMRYSAGEWRKLPADLSLAACVQTLFAGHCERPGGATYGRWMSQTLRLVPGKVEVSNDNRNFHTLADQSSSCVLGPME
ncbi:MAG TPA: hypothetical protein VFW47_05505 [Phenylobacterium sp.]|nr:hypothetical protein [Phenylobacterium sp.]